MTKEQVFDNLFYCTGTDWNLRQLFIDTEKEIKLHPEYLEDTKIRVYYEVVKKRFSKKRKTNKSKNNYLL